MMNEPTQHQSPEQLDDARNMSMSHHRPPAQIDGYEMLEHLGAGAFGQVWLALDINTGRRVAIKFYNRRSVSDVEALAKEVQKLVALSANRYVVQLLDVGWQADPPHYVMDYLARGSLEDLLRERKTLPVDEALELFQEVATGLMHLHGKGILHCDLKPGNVLLDQDNKPRLADFGQSRLSNEATPALGTLYYMAPEQADLSATPDTRWDVYALGALFYVMLTGRPPYQNQTLSEQLESSGDIHQRLSVYRQGIRTARPPQQHHKVPGVDRLLAEIIDRCIAADPKRRFASVQSILLALRQRQETINRRPLLVLGFVGPLLLLLIMTMFGWSAYRQAVGDSDEAIISKAVESNRFAARLAARSVSSQIEEYFRAAELLVREQSLMTAFDALNENQDLLVIRKQLADPSSNFVGPLAPIRQAFLAHPTQHALQNALQRVANSWHSNQVSSWWIYDRFGNQIASVFDQSDAGASPEIVSTLGRNYSFRSYFSGTDQDLVRVLPSGTREFTVTPLPEQRSIVQQPFLSAVFLSEATGTWKIAFSRPIRRDGEIVGVAGLTVEMGNFVDFESADNQYAMLFDQRQGPNRGIILEHPLFEELRKKGEAIPVDLAQSRMPSEVMVIDEFMDPIGATPWGEPYQHRSVIGMSPVNFTNKNEAGDSREADSGLAVVVAESFDEVIRPSHQLGERLARLALIASLFLIGVALVMWWVVVRMLRESRRQLARVFNPQIESGASLPAWPDSQERTPNADGAVTQSIFPRKKS
jgi:hypothetical protein